MTKPENNQPQLSCQELSKQCNDVDSSSSGECSRWSDSKKSLCRNLLAGSSSYSSSNHRKSSVGSLSQFWEQAEQHRAGSDGTGPKDLAGFHMFEDQHFDYDDDDIDDDDDDHFEGEMQDTARCYKTPRQCMDPEWLTMHQTAFNFTHDDQDFLDEIESTLHCRVDDEIDVFRANLHSIIGQRQTQYRHLFVSQEQEECISPQSLPHPPCAYLDQEQDLSPSQTVTLASESEETNWSADMIQSLSDQQRTLSQDTHLNRITVQLLSSALCVSNTLQREEYAT